MRTPFLLFSITAAVMFSHAAQAQPAPGSCEAKRADISREIDEAKAKGQKRRVRGLETALRESRSHCSDALLQQQQAARIAGQERKVAQRQRDLDTARQQGKAAKIADREAKLMAEEAELQKLRNGSR